MKGPRDFVRSITTPSFTISLLYAISMASLWRGDVAVLLLALALAPVLIWLSLQDLRRFELPDRGTALVALIALVFTTLTAPSQLIAHLAAALVVTAALWLWGEWHYRRRGGEGLGIGDAKLFGAGVLLLGPMKLPELFLLSSLGGIAGYLLSHRRGSKPEEGIPFGPFIAYAIFVLIFINPLFL